MCQDHTNTNMAACVSVGRVHDNVDHNCLAEVWRSEQNQNSALSCSPSTWSTFKIRFWLGPPKLSGLLIFQTWTCVFAVRRVSNWFVLFALFDYVHMITYTQTQSTFTPPTRWVSTDKPITKIFRRSDFLTASRRIDSSTVIQILCCDGCSQEVAKVRTSETSNLAPG